MTPKEPLAYTFTDLQNEYNKGITDTISEIKEELRKCYPSTWSTKPMEESEIAMSYRSFCRILDRVSK